MNPLTFELTITYTFYSFFLFYITKWMNNFRGASQRFYLFLIYFSGLGTIFGLSILVIFGFQTDYTYPLKLMGISIFFNLFLVSFETFITTKLLRMDYAIEKIGMISFFVVPILGVRLLILLKII